jgi:hypothetical protein
VIFGDGWKEVIMKHILPVEDRFLSRKLIFKEKGPHTKKGSITLGWRFELLIKPNGELSGPIYLNRDQKIEIFAGTNIEIAKRNSKVNGKVEDESGIAEYIIFGDYRNIESIQRAADLMIGIDEYIETYNPEIYFACKALNYNTIKNKMEGDRSLSVYIDWDKIGDKLDGKIVIKESLEFTGKLIRDKLVHTLKILEIKTTVDINVNNVTNPMMINI